MTMSAPLARRTPLLALLLLVGCAEDGGIIRLEVSGAFEPPMVDFGEVPIGLSREQTVTLVNTSNAPFTIDAIDRSSAFSIRASDGLLEERIVPAGARIDLELSFISIAETEWTQPLLVKAGELEIPLELHAVGVHRMVPEFTVEPPTLDFGVVEIGTTTQLPVAVKNVGNAPGDLMSNGLESGATDFTMDVPWPITVTEDIIGVFRINFTPSRAGSFSERMMIETNGDEPIVVNLVGEARGGEGQFFCTPASVTFGTVERGLTASRDIECTARGGAVQISGAELGLDAQYYALTQGPQSAAVADGDSVTYTVEFRPDGLPLPHEASLLLSYSGAAGPATLAIPISGDVGVPPPAANAITAVLRWDDDFTDVDLHLVRPGGVPFSLDADCFWASKAPDWGELNDQTDNPFLDADDIDGLGPETINLRRTAPGAYQVYVHYYADRGLGPTSPTVEVYAGGQVLRTATLPSLACNELWFVGTINWDGTAGTFVQNNGVTPTQTGTCQ